MVQWGETAAASGLHVQVRANDCNHKSLTEIATSKAELFTLLTKEVKSFSPKRSFVSRKHLSTEKAESLQEKVCVWQSTSSGEKKKQQRVAAGQTYS